MLFSRLFKHISIITARAIMLQPQHTGLLKRMLDPRIKKSFESQIRQFSCYRMKNCDFWGKKRSYYRVQTHHFSDEKRTFYRSNNGDFPIEKRSFSDRNTDAFQLYLSLENHCTLT